MRNFFVIVLSLFVLFINAQNEPEYLTKSEIENDLAFLDSILQNSSSYVGLNGYEYQQDFDDFLESIAEKEVAKYDFGLFLSKTIGRIGDRHSHIRGYEIRDSLYLPMAFAPFNDKVLVIDYDKTTEEYAFWNATYPYLKSINNIPINKIISAILPGDVYAPKNSYFTNAARGLRDIESVFRLLNIDLPNPLPLTLINEKGVEKEVYVELVDREQRANQWDERLYRDIYRITEEQYNDSAFVDRFFSLEDNIGYIQIPNMIKKDSCPAFFALLNNFMTNTKHSDALIIDVRDNGGGTRDLIQELAGYFIHSDSIYVVNTTKQRGELPLNSALKDALHGRYLYSKDELDSREQKAVENFMASFTAMYELNSEKFSQYHYYILNGQKLAENKYHYNKPIYILANERTFSAASILVSVFKGLPNINIVGVNTDGSSGNSKRFELPNSKLSGRISTMVSYQKNGDILDGIGTKPDILIERNIDQILWRGDSQLNSLIELIRQE